VIGPDLILGVPRTIRTAREADATSATIRNRASVSDIEQRESAPGGGMKGCDGANADREASVPSAESRRGNARSCLRLGRIRCGDIRSITELGNLQRNFPAFGVKSCPTFFLAWTSTGEDPSVRSRYAILYQTGRDVSIVRTNPTPGQRTLDIHSHQDIELVKGLGLTSATMLVMWVMIGSGSLSCRRRSPRGELARAVVAPG